MRYVVIVNPPTDHPGDIRVYGPFRNKSAAVSFQDCVREAVDKILDAGDEANGYAYVCEVEGARRRAAKLWATRGEAAV